MALSLLAAGITLFGIHLSWIVLAVVIIVGLLLIRTAITVVKVAFVVGIAIALWFLFEYVVSKF